MIRTAGENRRRPIRLSGALLAVLVAGAAAILSGAPVAAVPPVPATPPVAPPPGQATEVDRAVVEARLPALEAIDEPTATQQDELRLLRETLLTLDQIAEARAAIDGYDEAARLAPSRLAPIDEELRKPIDPEQPPIPTDATLEQLQSMLQSAQARMQAAERVRDDTEREFEQRNVRRSTIPDDIAAATRRVRELDQQLATPAPADEPSSLSQARRWSLLAQRLLQQVLLQRFDAEVRSYDERKENIRARRQLAQRSLLIEDQVVKRLEATVAGKREEAAREAQRAAERARREALNAHPVVQGVVAETEAVAAEITRVSVESKALNDRKLVVQGLLAEWGRQSTDVRRNLDLLGLSESIGLQLRKMRSDLPSIRDLREAIKTRRHEMNDVQLERSRRDDELLQLLDLDAVTAARLAQSEEPVAADQRDEVVAATKAALETYRDKYLAKLVEEYDRYFNTTLVPLYGIEQQLHDILRDFRSVIDENILWVQSTRRVEPADARQLWSSVGWLVKPDQWKTAAADLARSAKAAPVQAIACLVTILAIFILRFRLVRRLGEYAAAIPRAATDRYAYTLSAAGISIVLAMVPGPALMALIGWRLEAAPGAAPFSIALGAGLLRGAFLYAAAQVVMQLCRRKGLAEAHFRWRSSGLRAVRWHLGWFKPIAVPAGVLIGTTENFPVTAHHDALGRAVFILVMAAGCLFVLRLFRPTGALLQDRMSRDRSGWLSRTRYIWYPAFVLSPVVMAIVALLGYFYTAIQLERSILATVLLVVTLLVVHAMLLRWLIVAQRRIALEQARRRKTQAESGDGAPAPTAVETPVDEDKIDLAAVNLQTRKLLGTLLGFSLLIGVGIVWIDVLPAFGVLDEFVLWSEETPTALPVLEVGSSADSNGAGAAAAPSPGPLAESSQVTLADVVTAIFIMVITFAVGRNIPGLLEIAVLQRLPFTPGGRYAMTTLVRYLLVIIGLIMAFNAIGIGWSKVQWLAAAITFGLGFGLQEIFANFVSGLIILFERPVRVGDTVTVGTVSGVVARIRMRATTITDWDRKELIIPNKEFVTGQIINWSLSDSILRVRIPVGIAYGSDTALAKRLMLEVARENTRVLAEPAPQAMFLGFGESSLNFELRVHIPHIEHFMPARDELHEAVDRVFRKGGVEIAFPQRDLHVRSLPQHLDIVRLPEHAQREEG